MSEGIRVMIVDDHEMVREGLSAFLQAKPDLELVAEFGNAEDALIHCDRNPVDVVLMDLIMPEMDGVTAIRRLRKEHPEVGVIALTSFGDEKLVKSAIEAGAIGYLFKDVSPSDLAAAIRKAHAGETTLAPEATRVLIQEVTRPHEVGADLTEREMEVLSHLVEGRTNRQISQQLGISLSTAKFHVSSIISKLDVSSRTEAVSYALRHDLFESRPGHRDKG